ncbi:hypothetical protein CDD81_7791 [Ophiocordyceps australis]|uniref:Endopolyphosphatase n=1 Tax=Ophiocordyceps australis TaxID=1399860 RepID=A0A2C5Y2J6_9HYPO|nr:hypothetical protein CDD81_7791 [Ophiocordyceps australis]
MARAGDVCLWLQLALALAGGVASASPLFAPPSGSSSLASTEPFGAQRQSDAQLQPRLHGRFLHITDFHPDDYYKVHSSSESGMACHGGRGMAGTYGAEKTDCDSPFSLVNATFDWIADNLRDKIDFVVWTGDSARHDSDEKHPRHQDEVLDSNRAIANKFVHTFSSPKGKLSLPIVPTFGNNDFLPHNIMLPGPNKWFQAYADIWRRFIPEEQRHSFEFGGWFYVEVIPNKLAVFSLNTMFFFDRNAAVDGCAEPSEPGYKHMEWLRVHLQLIRQRGMKAILMGHVPPARTDSKQNWDETCWQRYTLWLRQYRDVVSASLFGHMNIDHFLLQDTKKLYITQNAEQHHDDPPLMVRSKENYLQELRDEWADLPDPIISILDSDQPDDSDVHDDVQGSKKKKKNKDKFAKIGGKYAERYQLSLVSPSMVPNYFPTLRVFEYNITGLEGAAVWRDSYDSRALPTSWLQQESQHVELRRHLHVDKKKKKKKKDKHRRPDAPEIVPEDPADEALPGPAYSAQPLTLTGYVQYYANLTHLNNDMPEPNMDTSKWRAGNPHKKPKHSPPRPLPFRFDVEYSTFDDKIYRLRDLTVKSYLHLAYRMGKKEKMGLVDHVKDDNDEDLADSLEQEQELSDGVDADKKKKKKKGKKRRKKKERQRDANKTWLHFLSHAFVKTVPKKDLKKM